MMKRLFLVPAFVAVVTATLSAQQANPVALAGTPVPPGHRIGYGSDPLQFGELRLPVGRGPHPVAVVVHGGCWLARLGNLDPRAVAMDNMRPFAAALTDAGIATWNIEYRRLGNEGGGWPGTFLDVANATDFLRTIAREHPLDLTRVVAVGHSSGGHFAMWLGGRPRIAAGSDLYTPEPLRLRGVMNLDGPGDLKATISLERQICGAPAVTDLMGGSPEDQPNRYRAGSPVELLPFGVPQVYFAGRMFGSQLAPYEAAAGAAGDKVQSISLPDAGHFAFIDPKSDVWPDVLQGIQHLLGMESVAP
jgi:acetyl esterase/lipase